ncbi:MAG: type II secretion system F family protein [Chloroflexi bacterium]|nr:MAG: type II secretion system F family protein [Chloroflexota bacterium]MBL1195549.1 type II secretion system F family protein [Chloroflexota bacterium]NOH12832.1 type II secretion system F family protein [Chloroflexota bacterium]
MGLLITFIILVIIIVAVALVVTGLRSAQTGDPLEERLAEFAEVGEPTSLEDIEMSQPFMDRVIYPTAQRMGEIALRFTPQTMIQDTQEKLEMAGNPRGLDPTTFLASRFIVGAMMGGALFFVFLVAPAWTPFQLRSLVLLVGFTLLGFFIPNLLLTSRVNSRQESIRKAMPDALDLLTICVEAGLGFDAAMKKVNEKWENELALAFGRALQEMQLGKLRREALRDMADRLGVSEMDSFVAAVIQSEQLGVSMAKVLRIQSDDMRVRRRQRAEEKAQQAPIKMLFPMALLIFPSIMIVLLGPAALLLFRSALGGILF